MSSDAHPGQSIAEGGRNRFPFGRALTVAVVGELAYIAGRAFIRANLEGMIPVELATTAWRLLSLGLYLWLFRDDFKAAWSVPSRRPAHPVLVTAIVLSFVVVLLAGYWQKEDLATRWVFALTTPVVALREELFYRFILQSALQRRMRPLAAIALTSVLFVLYHIGSQPMGALTILSLFGFGILLGVAYERTRSLRLVVAVHLVVDLLFIISIKVLPPVWVFFGELMVIFAALQAWSLDTSNERMGV